MELLEDVNAQLKAEAQGSELTKIERFALQQKFGLVAVLDTDIDWYLSLDAVEGRANGQL